MENEAKKTESNLRDEFRQLGENIRNAFHTAWDSEERQSVQQDIKEGLQEVGDSLNQAVGDFQTSETGQRLKQDMDEFGEKINSGELETRIRTDLAKILQKINTEIGIFLDSDKTDQEDVNQPDEEV